MVVQLERSLGSFLTLLGLFRFLLLLLRFRTIRRGQHCAGFVHWKMSLCVAIIEDDITGRPTIWNKYRESSWYNAARELAVSVWYVSSPRYENSSLATRSRPRVDSLVLAIYLL